MRYPVTAGTLPPHESRSFTRLVCEHGSSLDSLAQGLFGCVVSSPAGEVIVLLSCSETVAGGPTSTVSHKVQVLVLVKEDLQQVT